MNRLRLRSASLTHPGLVRSANEDSFLEREGDGIWVVADGMGGHANGQWASQVVVQALAAVRPCGDFEADVAALSDALHAANRHIYAASRANGAPMGSTAVVLHVAGERFAVLWAGDSRVYLSRGGRLHRLTRDHTQVQEMVERGLLTPEEATDHPMGHVLSRAIGVQEAVELEAVMDRAEPHDIFLLCSDGLCGYASDAEILERLGAAGGPGATRRLVELVLSRGAPDNVTVATATCEESTAVPFAAPVGSSVG